MQRTEVKEALKRTDFGAQINVRGWVRSRRGNKQVSFIALNDGSTIKNIQIVVDLEKFDEERLKPVTTGACISATGILVESQGAGQAVGIQLTDLEAYGTAAEKRSEYGVPAHNRAPPSAYQHLWCCIPYSS